MLTPLAASSLTSLLIIDADIADCSMLLNSLRSGIDVLVLDADQDGVAQITARLRQHKHLRNLHIVSHGAP